jgi:hypothetical protein
LRFRAKNNNPKFITVLTGKLPISVFRQILKGYLLEMNENDKKDFIQRTILIDQKRKLDFIQETE